MFLPELVPLTPEDLAAEADEEADLVRREQAHAAEQDSIRGYMCTAVPLGISPRAAATEAESEGEEDMTEEEDDGEDDEPPMSEEASEEDDGSQ